MSETCAVCHEGKGPTVCEVCGFSDNGFINRSFPIPEDTKNWIETVVKPYRVQWEAKKREAELLAQIEELKKREANLLTQLEETKKQNISSEVLENTFIDPRDGKVYRTVKIGSQVWLAENLNYDAPGSKFSGNDPKNGEKYGRLYDWETAKKACPLGWHLPTDDELDVLINFAGGKDVAGKNLKAKSGWPKNGNGQDIYGFAAIPGGYGHSSGHFGSVCYNGYWWSASENNSDNAYYRSMDYDIEDVYWGRGDKDDLFSVRCLQDVRQ